MVKIWKIEEVSKNNFIDGEAVAMTDAERQALLTQWNAYEAKSPDRKLAELRKIRNKKFQETDWLVTSEKITDAQKTWRQSLRDIPQNNTTEEQYDLLLAKVDGQLTHEIWSKP